MAANGTSPPPPPQQLPVKITASECFKQPLKALLRAIDETECSAQDREILRQSIAHPQQPELATELAIELLKSLADPQNVLGRLLLAEFSPSSDPSMSPSACDLAAKADRLKWILSRIPDKVDDKQVFLDTIKQIAAAIKANIDAINSLLAILPQEPSNSAGKNAEYLARIRIDSQKKVFVSSSRNFSSSLKSYFSNFDRDALFLSAAQLIQQTDALLECALKFDPNQKQGGASGDSSAAVSSAPASGGGGISGFLSSIWK